MRSIIGIGLLGVISLSGCVFLDDTFHKKELVSFALRTAENPGLRLDYYGTVEDGKVRINVPDYVDAAHLSPQVKWDGVGLEANGNVVSDGNQDQDFTRPLVYSVVGKDRERRDYEIIVSRTPARVDKALEYSAFGDADSGPYGSWTPYHAWFPNYDEDQIDVVEVPTYVPIRLNKAKIYLRHSGSQVKIDGVVFPNDDRIFDLTTEHTATVVAEDLSSRDYPIRVQWKAYLDGTIKNNGVSRSIAGRGNLNLEIQLPSGLDPSQCVINLFSPGLTGYPVSTAAGIIPFGTDVALDLTTPVQLTVSGPFLSRTYTLSVVETP